MKTLLEILRDEMAHGRVSFSANPKGYTDSKIDDLMKRIDSDPALKELVNHWANRIADSLLGSVAYNFEVKSFLCTALAEIITTWERVNEKFDAQLTNGPKS